jgi:hypothetical protein
VCRSIAGARSPSQPIRKYTNDGCSARVQNETSTSPFVGAASRCWLRAWRPGCVASAASSRDILMSPRRWTTCSSAGRHSRASSMNEPFDFLFAQAVEPIKERPLVGGQFRRLFGAKHGGSTVRIMLPQRSVFPCKLCSPDRHCIVRSRRREVTRAAQQATAPALS